jgi:hypothetical protein
LVEWIAWAEPQYDFNPMIDEWCKEAPKELDFNHEAGIFLAQVLTNIAICFLCTIFLVLSLCLK